ncbi:MAG: hypothetical protein ACO2PO_15040 [Candidatus Calescibacterium sp.]
MMDWRGVPRVIYDELGKEIWRGEFVHLESHYMKEVLATIFHSGCMGCIRMWRRGCIIM